MMNKPKIMTNRFEDDGSVMLCMNRSTTYFKDRGVGRVMGSDQRNAVTQRDRARKPNRRHARRQHNKGLDEIRT